MADPRDALDAPALRLASPAGLVQRVLHVLHTPTQPRKKQKQQRTCRNDEPEPLDNLNGKLELRVARQDQAVGQGGEGDPKRGQRGIDRGNAQWPNRRTNPASCSTLTHCRCHRLDCRWAHKMARSAAALMRQPRARSDQVEAT
jgi:hypothetical protein